MHRKVSNSFVIPCYNSEGTISNVVDEIESTMASSNSTYEIILVNDGSFDDTFNIIGELAATDSHIIGIDLSRNFGQHSALMAGIRQARGEVVICLDDDGQTPVNEVAKLINALDDGFDVVYAKYKHKKHSIIRNIGSSFNGIMTEVLLGKPKGLYLSSFFAMKKYIADEVVKYDNPYPYLMGLVLRTTNNIGNVDVMHRERTNGESGYTFGKLLGLWVNGATAFSIKPLRVATVLGFVFAVVGMIYGIWTVYKKIVFNVTPEGWASIVVMVLFVGGMIMVMQGMTGEYIGRMYLSMNRNPQYVVKRIVGSNEKTD